MRLFVYSMAAALLVSAGAATTAKPTQNQGNQPEQQLRQALNAMIATAQNGDNPPGQRKRPDDPDQGDDNAADRAILEVCFKDTPAAERSAICDRGPPISPD